MEFRTSELETIRSALLIAADVYTEDADEMRRTNYDRLAAQFERQTHDAQFLARRIEERS